MSHSYNIRFFPSHYCHSTKRFSAIIGFGGNIGNMNLRVKKLYLYLQKHPHIDIVQTSNLLKNPPFGYQFQDDFINGIMLIKTSLSPNQLLQQLLQIEKFFARKRSFANAPRTMDLDIIFFESKKMYNTHLTIPHPHWKERMSILAPLHSLLQHLHKESRL